ncbi:MAG: BON domain-containing protein [Desulfobulbus sp.]|nr:BON domain-containing protein [Desulfobulbus sp.]
MRKLHLSHLIATGILASGLLFISAPHSVYAAPSAITKTQTYMSDSAITTALKSKFLAEKGLDSMDIKVETTKGVVILRGQVVKKSQSVLAEKIARNTDGVRKVVNKISVMP